MALSFYDQHVLNQVRNAQKEGTDWRQFIPGNLSLLGPKYLRDRGIDPSQPSPGYDPSAPDGGARAGKPPRNYDPNWFKPQGNAPATPGANASVAAQSQVVRTPGELEAQYKKELAAAQQAQKENRDLQKMWSAYTSGFDNFSSAVQSNLGGRRVANPGDPITAGQPLLPGASAVFRVDPIDSTGQNYLGVPDSFVGPSGWDTAVGNQYAPSENRAYADALATQVRDQMRAGEPILGHGTLPMPTMSRYSAANGDGLIQRENVNTALTNWVNANDAMKQTKLDPFGKPLGLGGGSSPGDVSGLSKSWNAYQQNYNSTKIGENQAYLDQMGGGFYGGVVPSASNPQWYDTTPTWGAPNNNFGPDQVQQRAQMSPWGQPGAPWQSQAWASGMFNPNGRGEPQPAGQNGEIQDRQRWQASSPNMFDPQMGFNPSIATNAPWTPPKQQNNAFGATSTPGMTFGASPWGSFW
jgi:hypothetical protein